MSDIYIKFFCAKDVQCVLDFIGIELLIEKFSWLVGHSLDVCVSQIIKSNKKASLCIELLKNRINWVSKWPSS